MSGNGDPHAPQDKNALERIRLKARMLLAKDAQQAAAAHEAALERARQRRVKARRRRRASG